MIPEPVTSSKESRQRERGGSTYNQLAHPSALISIGPCGLRGMSSTEITIVLTRAFYASVVACEEIYSSGDQRHRGVNIICREVSAPMRSEGRMRLHCRDKLASKLAKISGSNIGSIRYA